jgi:hypothetical protein
LVSAHVSAFENAAADPVAKNGLLPEDANLLVERARREAPRRGRFALLARRKAWLDAIVSISLTVGALHC